MAQTSSSSSNSERTDPLPISFNLFKYSITTRDQPLREWITTGSERARLETEGRRVLVRLNSDASFDEPTSTGAEGGAQQREAQTLVDWDPKDLNAIVLSVETSDCRTESTVTLTIRDTSSTKVTMTFDLHYTNGFRTHLLERLVNRLQFWSRIFQIPNNISEKRALEIYPKDGSILPPKRAKTPPGYRPGVSKTMVYRLPPPPPSAPRAPSPAAVAEPEGEGEEVVIVSAQTTTKTTKTAKKVVKRRRDEEDEDGDYEDELLSELEEEDEEEVSTPEGKKKPQKKKEVLVKGSKGKGKGKAKEGEGGGHEGNGNGKKPTSKTTKPESQIQAKPQSKSKSTKPPKPPKVVVQNKGKEKAATNGSKAGGAGGGGSFTKKPQKPKTKKRGYVTESSSSSSSSSDSDSDSGSDENGGEKKKRKGTKRRRVTNVFAEDPVIGDPNAEGRITRRKSTSLNKEVSYVEKEETESLEDEEEEEVSDSEESDETDDEEDSSKSERRSSSTQPRRSVSVSVPAPVASTSKAVPKPSNNGKTTTKKPPKKNQTSIPPASRPASTQEQKKRPRKPSEPRSQIQSQNQSLRSRERTFSPETTETERRLRARSNREYPPELVPPTSEVVMREVQEKLERVVSSLENTVQPRLAAISKVVWSKEEFGQISEKGTNATTLLDGHQQQGGGGANGNQEPPRVWSHSLAREGGGGTTVEHDVKFLANHYEDLRASIMRLSEEVQSIKKELAGGTRVNNFGEQQTMNGKGKGKEKENEMDIDKDPQASTTPSFDLERKLRDFETSASKLISNSLLVDSTASSALLQVGALNARIAQLEKDKQHMIHREEETRRRVGEVEKERKVVEAEQEEERRKDRERMNDIEATLKRILNREAIILPPLPASQPQIQPQPQPPPQPGTFPPSTSANPSHSPIPRQTRSKSRQSLPPDHLAQSSVPLSSSSSTSNAPVASTSTSNPTITTNQPQTSTSRDRAGSPEPALSREDEAMFDAVLAQANELGAGGMSEGFRKSLRLAKGIREQLLKGG
ncbi:uncharacterized protein JCM6883_006393 [Sporobolomyces salmoneus]|uniref:uncharacterized protein n=1 Tax=Sporobolomyces salmoneus TaxID=183962 RepID=UPI003182889E